MELELSCRCREIDTFIQRKERDAECREVVDERDQVLQVAAQPIELPGHDDVELPMPRVLHQAIEGRPPVLGPRDAVVDVFDGRPAAGFDVAPELDELVLGFLVEGADTNVDGTFLRGSSFLVGAPAPKMAGSPGDRSHG
jgi:hypothetical protein